MTEQQIREAANIEDCSDAALARLSAERLNQHYDARARDSVGLLGSPYLDAGGIFDFGQFDSDVKRTSGAYRAELTSREQQSADDATPVTTEWRELVGAVNPHPLRGHRTGWEALFSNREIIVRCWNADTYGWDEELDLPTPDKGTFCKVCSALGIELKETEAS